MLMPEMKGRSVVEMYLCFEETEGREEPQFNRSEEEWVEQILPEESDKRSPLLPIFV
tara:strand:- start:2673 stop:2843 length:171 start_codon:yes stop_codon:yes gene_type:complete